MYDVLCMGVRGCVWVCDEMCANACLLIAVNVLGGFTRYSSERSRRLGFHETRNCMHCRLVIQRENQQQVRQ